MILLIRVYHNDQIQPVHVESFDWRALAPPTKRHRTDCRCAPTWTDYYDELAEKCHLGKKIQGEYLKFEFGQIETVPIYPTPMKRTT